VADTVAGVRAALRYDRSQFEVINLGNNHTVTLIEMIREIEEAMGIRDDRLAAGAAGRRPSDVGQRHQSA
jgi:nucleoside-diphosphate-sugar epimerase